MSCKEVIGIAGQDLNIQIPLVDQSGNMINGTPWKIVVVVRHASGLVVAKFSKNPDPGFGPMDVSNEAAGVITVKLLTSHTMATPLGKLYQQTHIQIADTASTDDNLLDFISDFNYCATIKESVTGGTVLP